MLRLSLGSANFGMAYGVSNKTLDFADVHRICTKSIELGVSSIDASELYDGAYSVLSRLYMDGICLPIRTKISAGCLLDDSFRELIDAFDRLRRQIFFGKVEVVMLHNLVPHLAGAERVKAFLRLCEEHSIQPGCSIYFDDFADIACWDLLRDFQFIQFPLSLWDRRPIDAGFIEFLNFYGIRFAARSIFLQGLVTGSYSSLPESLLDHEVLIRQCTLHYGSNSFERIKNTLSYLECNSAYEAVVGARNFDDIAELAQVNRNLETVGIETNQPLQFSTPLPEAVLDPRRWR